MSCLPASWLDAFTAAMWSGLAVMVFLCWFRVDMVVAATITTLYIIALERTVPS